MLLFLLVGFDRLRGLTGWVWLNKVYEGPVVKDRGRDSSEAGIPSFFILYCATTRSGCATFGWHCTAFEGNRATLEVDRTASDGVRATSEADRTTSDGDCATLDLCQENGHIN